MANRHADSRPCTTADAGADAWAVPGECRVVVGIDDTPAGIAALRRGLELAASADAPLVAVRAWDLGLPRHGARRRHHPPGRRRVVLFLKGEGPRRQAAEFTRNCLRAAYRTVPAMPVREVRIMAPQGEPGAVLTALARNSDVLVVGAGPGRWLRHAVHGSVSEYCQRPARCPVVTVSTEQQEVGHAG